MMPITRRQFVSLATLAALGLAGKPVLDVLSGAWRVEASNGLTAKRWAMAVDLKACSQKEGCTDCIAACNNAHNVPLLDNPKDEIVWLRTVPYEAAFAEHEREFIADNYRGKPTLVLCNHCENPPCVRVCPTQATWKREDGIVMMDYHRCIGCRYCMAACPYGSRSFNWRDPRPFIKEVNPDFPTRTKGVVEKCNFCEERLAKGLPPACVAACPQKGLLFGDLNEAGSEVRTALRTRYSLQRKSELGTGPKVYYLV